MEIKNSEGPATIFVRSFNFTHPYKFYIILFTHKNRITEVILNSVSQLLLYQLIINVSCVA